MCTLHRVYRTETPRHVLLISAKHDQVWPSMLMYSQMVQRMDKQLSGSSCLHVSYDTSHDVFQDLACWARILDFVKVNVSS